MNASLEYELHGVKHKHDIDIYNLDVTMKNFCKNEIDATVYLNREVVGFVAKDSDIGWRWIYDSSMIPKMQIDVLFEELNEIV